MTGAMLIVGIDPGLSGALAFMDPEQPASCEIADIPLHVLVRGGKTKREVDVQGLVGLLSRPFDHAFVEALGAMPGQGTVSMFAFGKVFGIILGVLGALGIPTTLVAPVTWKRALQVPKGKHAARARASQLLPGAASQWRLAKDHGKAEAALIALCGARQLNFATSPGAAGSREPFRQHVPEHVMAERRAGIPAPLNRQRGKEFDYGD